jgi:hypothetical protein
MRDHTFRRLVRAVALTGTACVLLGALGGCNANAGRAKQNPYEGDTAPAAPGQPPPGVGYPGSGGGGVGGGPYGGGPGGPGGGPPSYPGGN